MDCFPLIPFCLLAHAANEVLLYENLEKLGANALSRDNETELGQYYHVTDGLLTSTHPTLNLIRADFVHSIYFGPELSWIRKTSSCREFVVRCLSLATITMPENLGSC